MADFIKGNDYQNYPPEIAKGILLHREIDHYTDQHPEFVRSKRRLQPAYRHYSAVIVDMYYDHFLAANFDLFHNDSLLSFTKNVYETIGNHSHLLPNRAQLLLKYMSRDNWLLSYADIRGIEQALGGMSRRTKFKSNMEFAGKELRLHYDQFKSEFMAFSPDIIDFVKSKIEPE